MTTELTALVFSIVLGFVYVLAAANASTFVRGLAWNASARDGQAAPLTGVAGRLDRASKNFLETFAFFAAAVLIAHVADRHNALTIYGAWTYVVARAVYLPLYAAGIPYLRSLVWLISVAGIFMVLAGLYLL